MSHQATAWAYKQRGLTAGRKFVLVALADFADEQWSCFPGQERLAQMTGQDVRSVRRHIEELERLGLLTRERRFLANGQRTSDRYKLVPPATELPLPPADILTGGHFDLRSDSTALPDTVSGDPLENPQPYPLTPGKPGECSRDEPIHTDCRTCGTSRRELAKAAKVWRPEWCGDCDEQTRMLGFDSDAPTRCPSCHPSTRRKVSA